MGCEESDWQLMATKTIIKNENLKKKKRFSQHIFVHMTLLTDMNSFRLQFLKF